MRTMRKKYGCLSKKNKLIVLKNNELLHQFQGFYATNSISENPVFFGLKNFDFPEFEINSKLIEDLENIQHPRNSVLGKRMESFFELAIKYSSRYDLIASNIQIIQNKQTLGELDFLVFDNLKNKPLHIELVYKLYIYNPFIPKEIDRWIGPNRRDSLSKKLEKLKTQQLPLLYAQSTKNYLGNYALLAEDIEQQICFKAQLYFPENYRNTSNFIDESCFSGNWYRFSEFLIKGWEQNEFYSPNKLNWCATPRENTNWCSFKEIYSQIQLFMAKEKSPLVWMKTPAGNIQRLFVVSW